MDYNRIYHNLVTTRQNLKRFKSKETFFESHHILPKCLGGTDDITNLVLLTPKEHYIAHLLLTKMYVGKEKFKMYFAFWRMSSRLKILNANQYQYAKELLITAAKNKIISPEQKAKLSKAHLGKTLSLEHREKNIKNLELYRNTEKRLENLKEALKKNIGKKLSVESIEKRTKTRKERGNYVPWNKGLTGKQKMSPETIEKRNKTRKENGWFKEKT